MVETPEGLRFPVGLDTSSLRKLMNEAGKPVRGAPGSASAWLAGKDLDKIPEEWGPGRTNRSGVGTRWTDPDNEGNGIRIDRGSAQHSYPTQQVDHVVVRHDGKIIGRDGKPITGSIERNPAEAHIPLTEWLRWSEWWRP
jgi:hypothetical protein